MLESVDLINQLKIFKSHTETNFSFFLDVKQSGGMQT